MSKKILLSFLLSVLVILTVSITSVSAETITVALHPDSKPFLFLNDNNEISGIDFEVIHVIAGIEELDVKFVLMNFEEMIEAAASCKVDASISSMTRTEEREEIALFSEPYFIASQILFVKSSREDISSIESEGIRRIAIKADSTAESKVNEDKDKYSFEIVTFNEYPEMFEALENENVDAVLTDDVLGKLFVEEYEDIVTVGSPVTEEPYAIAVCPKNPELLEKINDGLAQIRNNGTLDLIVTDNLNK